MSDGQPQPASAPVETAVVVPPPPIFTSVGYSGPLPPPAMIEHFGRVDPTYPRVIAEMALKEQTHRHVVEMALVGERQERTQIDGRSAEHAASIAKRGQVLGFFLGVGLVGVCVVLAWTGQGAAAATLAGSTMATVFGVLAISKWHR